jgi:eukaryotic-like serine/threonine-protein kinase
VLDMPDETPSGTRFGAWEVVGVLGQGGMGRVYDVVRIDGGFSQKGALKLVARSNDADQARFRTERQILADLDHSGLAKVFDGGLTASGEAWMVMEKVDGTTLDKFCAITGSDLAARIALVRGVGDALAAAHAKLILHRDLKPSNILVDGDGRTKLIDFGIAKRISLGERTQDALPISAPYAAPELLTGAPVGPATDVYGLAALLYDLACLAPPIALEGLPAALGIGRVLDTVPDALTLRIATSPVLAGASSRMVADLDAVLAKALRKEPEARYPTLQAFLDDLDRVISGSGVRAREGEQGYLLKRLIWRQRVPLLVASLVATSLIVGTGLALWQANAATAARDAAVVEADRSEAVRQSLFLLLGEATEAAGPQGSRTDVLNRASTRLQRDFIADPVRYGPILKALGELYFHSNDYEGALGLLTPVASLPLSAIQKPGQPAPEVIAEAKVDLAQVLIRMGKPEEARPLLVAAQAFMQTNPERWRTDLIDSRLTEAQLVRDLDKDVPKAIALLQTGLADRIAVSGVANRDVGIFQNNLGVTLQASGDLKGALDAFAQARTTWIAIGAAETPDALNTLNNLGAVETLTGRPEAAEPLFKEAVRLRRSLFGPSTALAALINNQAKVLLTLKRPNEALPLAQEAVTMGEQFAGAGSMIHVAALAGLSEAQVAIGESAAGLVSATNALAAAQAKSGQNSPSYAVAALAAARAHGASGNKARAQAQLDSAAMILSTMGPAAARLVQSAIDIAQTYDLNAPSPPSGKPAP